MKAILNCLLIMTIAVAASAWAAGGGGRRDSAPGKPADAVIEKARAAIAAQDWKQAQDVMREALSQHPENADYHNFFAYSMRMDANPPMDLVFRHYNEALRLDPSHRGAHEYLGEAYLMTGNLEKAKEHLRVLDRLCVAPCKEYAMLKKAIAEYEAKQASK